MKRIISGVGLLTILALGALIIAQAGCQKANKDEMPITTKSAEARKLFIEGRQLSEFWHNEKANLLFAKAIEVDPEFALGYYFKALTSTKAPEAKTALEKAVALASGASEAERTLIASTNAIAVESDWIKAHELNSRLAEMLPRDKRAQWYLGQSFSGRKEYDKAIAAWEKALAIDKDFAPVYESMGYVYRFKNQYDKAEAAFKEYVKLSPGEPNAHDILGDLYWKMGKFDDAIGEYKQAVGMDQTFSYSQYKMGMTLAFLGKYDEARQAIEKTMDMELDPTNKVYDTNAITRIYMYAGDYAKALESIDRTIQMAGEQKLVPTLADSELGKCALYYELGDFDKAEARIAEGLKIMETAEVVPVGRNNFFAGAAFWDAWVTLGRKDFQKAMAKADAYKAKIAIFKDPNVNDYYDWLVGCILAAKGDYAQAEGYFSRKEIDDPFFLYYYGLCKEKAGDLAGARTLYKKVADWNLDSFNYALVRSKALAKL